MGIINIIIDDINLIQCRPHPHNLVGRHCRGGGVCTVEINSDSMTETFSNLGIQCVKRRDIDEALRVRQEQRVDPFRSKFRMRAFRCGEF